MHNETVMQLIQLGSFIFFANSLTLLMVSLMYRRFYLILERMETDHENRKVIIENMHMMNHNIVEIGKQAGLPVMDEKQEGDKQECSQKQSS